MPIKSMPHIVAHQEHSIDCPCCGSDNTSPVGDLANHGNEVFEEARCKECGAEWTNEWRLYATKLTSTSEVAIKASQSLAALLALQGLSMLDPNPADSAEIAATKLQALDAIKLAQTPS